MNECPDTSVELVVRKKPTRPFFYAKCQAAGELFTGYGSDQWDALADAAGKAREHLAGLRAASHLPGNPARIDC